MKEKFLFRCMTEEDVAQVEKIEKEAYQDPWSDFSYITELNDNRLANYFVICIEEQPKTVVAYGGFWSILDEGHITKVTVANAYRGQGLGTMLMTGMLAMAAQKGAERATLEVRVSNHRAIGLYEKMGFVSSGIRPKYYADNNEDAVIMWREMADYREAEQNATDAG